MDTMTVTEYAQSVWENGSADDVWNACFRMAPDAPELVHEDPDSSPTLTDVAGELLERIAYTPDFQVGDLTHAAAVAAIVRRHPLLGASQ